MLRYGSGRTVSTTTTTTEESPDSERRITRLRLTLHEGDNGSNEPKTTNSDTAQREKDVNGAWKKKNGLIQRGRPAGRESPQQHPGDTTNGVTESSTQHHGPKVYGVVQRAGSDRQQEVMAREWTVTHLQDEMKYIKDVRDSLEKVRERMYGQFGGMQQSMQKLSQEIRSANSHRRSLESEVRVRTAAMDSFDQMNSSLISDNITLQKSLLENCQSRLDTREEVKSLRSNCEKTQEKLRDKERELAAAKVENQTLRLQVEASQEAHVQALHELSKKLQREYDEKLLEEQRSHREEIENLQAELEEYIRRLEDAEIHIRTAEAKINERDQRIMELERLLDCMSKEKSQLNEKLQECEQRLRLMELTDTTDSSMAKRSKGLQEEAGDLRERIKHLNDMVFCQQRKVKGMIEEVESLRAQVAQKDMFISELLDRIAIVECENNELDDKLKYFMSTQTRPKEAWETREIGVGCDLLPRREVSSHDTLQPTHLHPNQLPPLLLPPPSMKPPSATNPFPPPLSPTQPLSPFQPLSPTQPLSPFQPLSPTQPLSPFQPLSPTQPFSPFQPLPTTQPFSPFQPLSPTQPLSPLLEVPSPTQPLPPTQPLSTLLEVPSPTQPLPPTQPLSPLLELPSPTQPLPPTQPLSPPPPLQHPSLYLTMPTRPRTFNLSTPPPSRLESSLLRYTPVEYSQLLSRPRAESGTSPYTRPAEPETPVSPGRDEVDAATNTDTSSKPEESTSSQPSSRARSRASGVYTPFMRLMEITAQLKIEPS